MEQVARNLTDPFDGFLRDCRYLIHDRSSLFTAQLLEILGAVGVESVRLPPRSPNLNALAERFVEHYHRQRNHQGIENKLLMPDFDQMQMKGCVACCERLGGMLKYYHRKAA